MATDGQEYLQCPGCGGWTIPSRPLPALDQKMYCGVCGHQEKFRTILELTPTKRKGRDDPKDGSA